MATRQPRNPRIASKIVGPKTVVEQGTFEDNDKKDAAEQAKMDERIAINQAFRSIPERVARSKRYYKNWLWDHDAKHFVGQTDMKHVDFYFPETNEGKGKPLCIDMAMDSERLKECEKKATALNGEGFRYLALTPHMTDAEIGELVVKLEA